MHLLHYNTYAVLMVRLMDKRVLAHYTQHFVQILYLNIFIHNKN